jgi:hypothetical protein
VTSIVPAVVIDGRLQTCLSFDDAARIYYAETGRTIILRR